MGGFSGLVQLPDADSSAILLDGAIHSGEEILHSLDPIEKSECNASRAWNSLTPASNDRDNTLLCSDVSNLPSTEIKLTPQIDDAFKSGFSYGTADVRETGHHERFACPLRKHDPKKYSIWSHRSCALSGFPTIARLK
ncbi:hypothetical protein DL95DRAFT_411770 [Leptodontidium sp. 2 PMI_412]|nr:hypothetical protein DL95DRAFT_411770 [Leptodontidium sp. 2 PMI_412]